jgi:DNA-binding protein HU-beta
MAPVFPKIFSEKNFLTHRHANAKGGTPMTKGDLVNAVAKAAGLNKSTAGEAVDAIFDSLARAIRKDKQFQVPGFGTFTVRSRKARKGRNPQTGDEIAIKASRTVGFKPAPDLKRSL